MEKIRLQCKKMLLRDGYGKFALVEKILSTERLLTDKPFLIYLELLDLLGNQANRLNRNSFYTWLRRWRQKHSKKDVLPAQKEKEWKEYQAPSLSALSGGNDPIVIEFIKPK